jgi:TrmH family RNA methyltransferase
MSELKQISSLQNPLIKQIVALKSKASERRELGLCVIEGEKEIEVAFLSGIEITTLLFTAQVNQNQAYFQSNRIEKIEISQAVLEKISTRENSAVAIAKTKYTKLSDIKLSENPFVLILENIEKPGNLGSLFRSADAADVELILCTQMQTDLYNSNVIRNSLGCVFSKQIVYCSNEEALAFCQKNHIQILGTYLHIENYYYGIEMQKPTAILMGTEHSGISDYWVKNASNLIKIPMLGKIDSMNVSNSAAIMLYEVVRQRISSK